MKVINRVKINETKKRAIVLYEYKYFCNYFASFNFQEFTFERLKQCFKDHTLSLHGTGQGASYVLNKSCFCVIFQRACVLFILCTNTNLSETGTQHFFACFPP